MFSFPECITWLAVGITESVAIVTLNIITIIVFIKNRNLRKPSTYLVINLAVVDLLIGGCAVASLFYNWVGGDCNVWEYNFTGRWKDFVLFTFYDFLLFSSLTNITAISVERLHAILQPFSHRVIRKLVYVLIVATVWATAGSVSISARVLLELKDAIYYLCTLNSFIAICLLVICVSYACIVIKVRCGAQPRHHGAASRERKLTMTLLIVTVASLLLYLPFMMFNFLESSTVIASSMSGVTYMRLRHFLRVLFFANSLVNPILYAICMPEFRSAVLALFRRRPQQQRQVAVLPLHDM